MRYVRLAPRIVATASFVWSIAIGWWLWTRPFRSVGLVSSAEDPNKMIRDEKIFAFSDISALGGTPLLIPIALTGLAMLAAWTNRAITLFVLSLALMGYSFITGFSIGNAYMPAAYVLVIAACIGFALDDRVAKK